MLSRYSTRAHHCRRQGMGKVGCWSDPVWRCRRLCTIRARRVLLCWAAASPPQGALHAGPFVTWGDVDGKREQRVVWPPALQASA